MRLEDQIMQLEQEKADELELLKHHSARATRDVKRMLSPDRMIRKHITAAMIAAAVAGLMIAPAPKYAKRSKSRKARRGSSGLLGMLSKMVPGLDQFMPQEAAAPAPEEESHASAEPPGLFGLLLGQVASMVMSRVDWQALLHQWMGQMQPEAAGAPANHDGHPGGEPNVSVGDAGTGRPPE